METSFYSTSEEERTTCWVLLILKGVRNPSDEIPLRRRVKELVSNGVNHRKFRIFSVEEVIDADKCLQPLPAIGEFHVEGVISTQSFNLIRKVADETTRTEEIGLGIEQKSSPELEFRSDGSFMPRHTRDIIS